MNLGTITISLANEHYRTNIFNAPDTKKDTHLNGQIFKTEVYFLLTQAPSATAK